MSKLVDLRKCFLSLNKEELKAFMADLMTPSEIRSCRERWNVACLLYFNKEGKKGTSYRSIHETTGVSVATITRVARFLRHEQYGGYKMVMDRLIEKNQSLSNTDFLDAMGVLKNESECSRFLNDICTPPEIFAMEERLDVAYLLYVKKMSYSEVHDKTSVSIATITRVARFLQHESNHGYKILFSKIQEKGGAIIGIGSL